MDNTELEILRNKIDKIDTNLCQLIKERQSLASQIMNAKKGNFPFLANGKSQTMSNAHGFVKTLFNSETGEFLGAHLIGPDVTEMISTFGLAITSESTEDEFINTIFAHPTLSESIHESVLSAFDKPIHF